MSVDTHIRLDEVYLRPADSDDTEIAVSLGAIEAVELIVTSSASIRSGLKHTGVLARRGGS